MKKIFFLAAAAFAFSLGASAQTVISNNYDSPISSVNPETSKESSFVQGSDINVSYCSDTKFGSLSFMMDAGKSVYWGLDFGADIDGFDSYGTNFLLGVGKRYLFSDMFLLQGKIGLFAGYSSYEATKISHDNHGNTKETTESKSKFNYGANGNIALGIKLWDTKKGNSTFITVGYYITASEFETKDMFKNGSWGIGFTTILN